MSASNLVPVIIWVVVIGLILYFFFSVFLKGAVGPDNVRYREGPFGSLTESHYKDKKSLIFYMFSFDGEDKMYRIPNKYKDCFAYENFMKEVTFRQRVRIGIDTRKGPSEDFDDYLVSLESDGYEYIDRDCVNTVISTDKKVIAFLVISVAAIAGIIYLVKWLKGG